MCIFCKIINNEIPCYKIYEDNFTIAFLDISQTTYGHTLVMPKKHVKNILDCDDVTYTNTTKTVKLVAQHIINKLDAKGCNILSNCNEVAGQSVDHLHFHIIPRYSENDSIKISFIQNEFDLKDLVTKITMNPTM